jgi:hypothetical protein
LATWIREPDFGPWVRIGIFVVRVRPVYPTVPPTDLAHEAIEARLSRYPEAFGAIIQQPKATWSRAERCSAAAA